MGVLKSICFNGMCNEIPDMLSFEVVDQLPATGTGGIIYLVPNADAYDEYVWTDDGFFKIGTTNQVSIEKIEKEINELKETKANIDGYYPNLHVGTSNQLLADTYTTDEEPYHYRQTPSHAGTREMDEIVGGSVVWNQLVNTSTSSVTVTSGHKYVAKISDAWSVGASTGTALSVTGGTDMVFDITQMFPTAIADHIYNLEQATAGAGVEFFRKYFPEEYYAFDAGTMRSVEGLVSHDTVGFNQWDEEWEVGAINTSTGQNQSATNIIRSKNYIAVFPSTSYYRQAPVNVLIFFYDADKSYISFGTWGIGTFVTPVNCHYIRFYTYTGYGATYKNDICINISDTAKNGQYEPYEKHSYSLDNTVTLRGIPQLVNGQLKFDGDTYRAEGVVTRRYGIETYDGTENWTVTNNGTLYRAILQKNNTTSTVNLIGNYVFANNTYQTSYPNVWKAFINSNKALVIGIPDTITDATVWKNYLASHPLTLVYELATPTTEQAEPYQSLQICSPYGTEEYVTTGIVPIGHYTKYPTDLKSIVEQIADAPSADGVYTLKATVSGGKVTYSWESA